MAAKINVRERAEIFVEHGTVATPGGAVARWLRGLRTERGIPSQIRAAQAVGVAASSWAGWEVGTGLPGKAAMVKIEKWAGPENMAVLAQMLAEPVAPVKAAPVRASRGGRGGRAGGSGADDLMVAIIGSALGEREKAALCAAVVAMNAGIEVRVELLV